MLSPAIRDWRILLHQDEQVLVNNVQSLGDLENFHVAAPLK